MKKFLRAFWVQALVTCVLSAFASAQQVSGVSGVVTDNSGGTVSGVAVALDNPNLGIHLTTTTNDIGYFQFLKLSPAEGYNLTFTKDSFRKLVISNLTLGATTIETRNVTLEIGSVTQSVEVQASGEATLNTTDATVGNVIDSRYVHELPIQFRLDAANLMQLQAGVNDAGSITGARSDQGNITLDGMDLNDQATGQAFTSTVPVSVDALQEVRTVTAGETADFGRSSGGMINLVTRGGTNEFHGNLREYNRNTDFAANDWFANRDGIKRPSLNRNQFGGNIGGPIKKDKLFFFFDYEGLRVSQGVRTERAVPTPQFLSGQLGYINSNAGCDGTARLNNNPNNCITFLTPTEVQAIDPAGIGDNAEILSLLASRYPAPNDPSFGDGINTEGFLFYAPAKESDNVYTGRLDFNLSENNKLFLRGTVARQGVDDFFNTSIVQFPGDPAPNSRDQFNSYTFALGWVWTPTGRITNQATAALTRSILNFPSLQAPTFPYNFNFSPDISNPYLGFGSQSRNVPVPELRDNVTWLHGKHTVDIGTDIKWIRQISALRNDFYFPTIGLGGNIQSLDSSVRPGDLNGDSSAISDYDNFFPFLLGRYAGDFANINYSKSQTALPPGTGKSRDYNYNEFELYVQDSWKVRSDLTLTFGLRWNYHTVPYEVNGFESTPSVNENAYFSTRLAAAAQGVSGLGSVPLVSYSPGGAANNARGYYEPDYKDLGPRVAVAYNPSFRSGVLHDVFGDRKSTIRLGGAILYDRIGGGASFGLDQNTFLFDTQVNQPNGIPFDAFGSLLTDPRFTGLNNPPAPPASPVLGNPNTPNVDSSGIPFGTTSGGFPSFFQFDRNTKSPYSILLNFGVQRELPGNFLLEANYVGRLGRRLLAVGDAATITDFVDNTSGQHLRQAFGLLQQQEPDIINNPLGTTPIPWFENQMGGTAFCVANFGANCTAVTGFFLSNLVLKGDLSDTVQQLAAAGLLNSNVGLPAQTSANGYIGNYASSNYTALLVSLRKRMSAGLQFDFNYTFSHSIDNVSEITNNFVQYTAFGSGLVCDLENLRICRASSDFDARHTFTVNYLYDLPFGHGRAFGRNSSKFVDAVVGGWTSSGIIVGRTGYPFSIHTGAFPTAFTLDSPATLVGPVSDLKAGIHTDSGGSLQYFANPTTALSAVDFTFAGAIGTRNVARGPGYWNIDFGMSKSFKMPWAEGQRLAFRWDAFNLLNHPVFNGPSSATLSSTSNFGIITSTASAPRVMQVALRYEF